MAYLRLVAIVVSSDCHVTPALHERAVAIFGAAGVSSVAESPINGVYSFLVAPDASGGGYKISLDWYDKRAEFVRAIEVENMDGRIVDWVEVQYGDDNDTAKVIRGGDDNVRG